MCSFALFSQELQPDTTTIQQSQKIDKPHFKYEIGMALGTSLVSYPLNYPLVPTFNLEFGVSYSRWKFKLEPKVSYAHEDFNYGLTGKVGFVIWKSK